MQFSVQWGIDVKMSTANAALIDQFRHWLQATGHSKATIQLRITHVKALAARCDLATATEDDVIGLFMDRAGQMPASRQALRSSLRAFYKWATPRGIAQGNPIGELPPVRVPAGVPKPVPEDIYRDALAKADPETRLILLLGGCAGLRISEIAAFTSDCIVEGFLVICGKGGRTRRIPIHPALAVALESVHGYAFPSPLRAREYVTPRYIESRVLAILPAPWTAHSLRHRFGTMAFRGSHNLRSVQELLGHSSPATTAKYTLIDDDDLRTAVRSIAA